MSDIILPISNPVYLTSLQDVDLIDLYSRYGVLARAYEALVKQSSDEKRVLEHQIRSLTHHLEKPEVSRLSVLSVEDTMTVAALECKNSDLIEKINLLETSLETQRKINADLENDLNVAIAEGMKYRDSLKKMIEIRETEEKKVIAKKAKAEEQNGNHASMLDRLHPAKELLASKEQQLQASNLRNEELNKRIHSASGRIVSLEIENAELVAKVEELHLSSQQTVRSHHDGSVLKSHDRVKPLGSSEIQPSIEQYQEIERKMECLEAVCGDVQSELSRALALHQNWLQRSQQKEDLQDINKEPDKNAMHSKKLFTSTAGMITPARPLEGSIINNTVFNSSVAFATPTSQTPVDAQLSPPTPELDQEEWQQALYQYESAEQGTVEDFLLVNKRFSTVHIIAIDGLLTRHKNSIKRVDLSYNYLRNSGIISLTPLFRTIPNLTHLDCGDNHIGDTGADALAEFLSSSNRLAILAIGGNKISDAGLSSIAAALPKTLHTLNLNFNLIGGQGAKRLAAALPNTALAVIYLDGNRIESSGIIAFGQLREKESITLKQLHLRGNPGLLDNQAKTSMEQLAKKHLMLNLFV